MRIQPRAHVWAALAGALTVEVLFTLFNKLSLPSTIPARRAGPAALTSHPIGSRSGRGP